MKANATKFQVLLITRDKSLPKLELQIDGTVLQSEPHIKLLGIHIDRELNFHYHITMMCQKASNQVRAMARLSYMLDAESKLVILNAFIISNFMYCPLVWHMCSIVDSKKLEKIQKRALCYVFNDFNESYANLLTMASKSTLYISRLRMLVTEVFKALNDMSPNYMKSMFVKKEVMLNQRNNNILVQPKYNTVTYGFNSIRYQGSKLWNSLPNEMKCLDGIAQFRRMVRKWSGPVCNCGFCLQCTLMCQ